MKPTKQAFTKKMNKLTTAQIIDLIKMTWKDSTGELFREIGFEIIEEREGEEYSDKVYAQIWQANH